MFFEGGASQVDVKIGPEIDFGGLWAPLCNTLERCCFDVAFGSAFLRNNGIMVSIFRGPGAHQGDP